MPRSLRYQRWRRQRRLALLCLAITGALMAYTWRSPLDRTAERIARAAIAHLPLKNADAGPSIPKHPVYPYSVIHGGAYSAAELGRALAADPIAARHYEIFSRRRVRTVASPFSSPVYVSYRVGNQVYWMRRAILLQPQETLLTDGTHYARARCGNRVSVTPQLPVADTEPPAEVLEQPVKPPGRLDDPVVWSESRIVPDWFSPVAPGRTVAGATSQPAPVTNDAAWLFIPPVPGGLTPFGPEPPREITITPAPLIEPNPMVAINQQSLPQLREYPPPVLPPPTTSGSSRSGDLPIPEPLKVLPPPPYEIPWKFFPAVFPPLFPPPYVPPPVFIDTTPVEPVPEPYLPAAILLILTVVVNRAAQRRNS